jgi:hypothetical protein
MAMYPNPNPKAYITTVYVYINDECQSAYTIDLIQTIHSQGPGQSVQKAYAARIE